MATRFQKCVLTVAAAIVFCSAAASAEDWPQWRGPRGDGTWQPPPLAESWPEEGLPQVWRRPIGGGYGGISVVGQRLYVMDRQTEPHSIERVLCLDTRTGDTVWEHSYAADYGDLQYGNGPRATPTVFENRVYTFGTMGHTHCLDAEDGHVIWSHDLLARGDAAIPQWGLAASPVVWQNLLIVHPGATNGCYIAFDRITGEEIWRSGSDPAGYCTPIVIDHQGEEQLVGWTPEHIVGMRPRDGQFHWTVPYEVTYGVSIATPVYHRGIVFVTGYWHGSKAIRLGLTPNEAELLWEENRFLRGLMCQPLCRDGFVYSLDKGNGLVCFDIKNGEIRWTDKHQMTPRGRNPQANLVWLGDSNRVLALNSAGELILARLTPEAYEELSRTKVIDRTWAHPAFAGECVFARNDEEIVCVRLKTVP